MEEHMPEAKLQADENPIIFIFPAGLFPGAVISYEQIRRIQELEEQRNRDRNNKPSRPPRRPNAKIGRIAPGNP